MEARSLRLAIGESQLAFPIFLSFIARGWSTVILFGFRLGRDNATFRILSVIEHSCLRTDVW